MGDMGKQILLKILNKIAKRNEIPEDLEIQIILSVFKKGDVKVCRKSVSGKFYNRTK